MRNTDPWCRHAAVRGAQLRQPQGRERAALQGPRLQGEQRLPGHPRAHVDVLRRPQVRRPRVPQPAEAGRRKRARLNAPGPRPDGQQPPPSPGLRGVLCQAYLRPEWVQRAQLQRRQVLRGAYLPPSQLRGRISG